MIVCEFAHVYNAENSVFAASFLLQNAYVQLFPSYHVNIAQRVV